MKQELDYSRVYQETVNYINTGLPVYLSGGFLSYYPSMGHPCHYHGDVEFLYAISGHLTYSVNGELVRVGEGEGIFVNSRRLHYGFSEDGTDCVFFCIVLNPMLLSVTPYLEQHFITPLTENSAFNYQVFRPDVPWQDRVLEQMNRAWALFADKETGYELALQSCFFSIWGELFGHLPPVDPKHKNADAKLNILRAMVGFLQTHSTERVTLQGVADAGHVCQSTCCRLFQKYLRRSPMEYLNEYRLSQAVELLRHSTKSVTEIADQVGFGSASYFTEQFHRSYGCTPTQYRDSCRKQEL